MALLIREVVVTLSGLFVVAGISGCGGGSSSSSESPDKSPDFEISPSSTINENTSQANRTSKLWIDYQAFRTEHSQPAGNSFGDAVAYADFDGDGETDVFIAPGTSLYDSVPFEFYRNLGDGSFELATEAWIDGEVPELPHPRKSIVADFNDDGRPDVLVADHGPEQEPEADFPGGHVWLMLSQEDGTYDAAQLTTRLGFYHGAAAGDLNGDGLPDVFVTDSPSMERDAQPEIFINQGGGVLERAPDRLGADIKNLSGMYTTEIYDLDKDGFADIIVAGHEQDGMSARVLWGSSTGYYTRARSLELPAVSGWGTVVDIASADINGNGLNDLVLARTGGGGDNNFYRGYYIQVIEQGADRSFSDVSESALNGSGSDTDSDWISWIRLQDVSSDDRPDILVDDKRFCLRWDNDGNGQFNLMTDACTLTF
ncbi:FG-GAP repeat domain-containing protein [Marinobacter sp.]|uniref:FG-GAP repeat domain-containing protein n=1 Tax=Marinobacter sp. TaxID=50741 RepID=UPI0034A36754